MSKTRKPRRASKQSSRSVPASAGLTAAVASAPADLSPSDSPLPAGMTLVGVGASAGGLQAFTELIESIPADAGLTLVLVQHISPKHESALPALLASHTQMPVTQVIDGARLELNHIYVIPPNVQMQLVGNVLQLS